MANKTIKKTAVKKPATKKATTKKPAAKKTAVKKTADKKTPAKKKPAVKKLTVKKVAVKKPAEKKPPVKKKTAVKKPAVKKTAAKKPAEKKPSVKKTAAAKTKVKKQTVKKTAVKESAVKKPSAEKPAAKIAAGAAKAVIEKKTPIKKTVVKEASVKKPELKDTLAKKTAASEWISVDEYKSRLNLSSALKPVNPSLAADNTQAALTDDDIAGLYWQESRQEDLLNLCRDMLSQKDTKNSSVWLKRQSDSLCYLGRWKDALETNKKRTSLFPEESDAWNVLALSCAVLGDYKNAAAALEEAEGKINWDIPFDEPDADKKPGTKAEFKNLGVEGKPSSFSKENWRKYAMFTLYPKILEKAPNSAFGWYSLAKFYGDELCYYDEASAAIEKAAALKPGWKPVSAYKTQMLSFISKTNSAKTD